MNGGAVKPGRESNAESRRFDGRGDHRIGHAADRGQERCERAALDAGRRMRVTLDRVGRLREVRVGMGLRTELGEQDDQRQDQ